MSRLTCSKPLPKASGKVCWTGRGDIGCDEGVEKSCAAFCRAVVASISVSAMMFKVI